MPGRGATRIGTGSFTRMLRVRTAPRETREAREQHESCAHHASS
jgi:hypothetical protein